MVKSNSDSCRYKGHETAIFDAMASSYYDCVIEYDIESGKIEFLHISGAFSKWGFVYEDIDSFDELIRVFTEKMVISEEKTSCLEQITLSYILAETRIKENYVRTIHINTPDGIKAEGLRITPIKDTCNRFLVCFTDISMILDRDWMTDEYSRSGFIARVEKLLEEPEYQKEYSIIYTNIPGFKAINDILGTHNGDMIILGTCSNIVKEFNPVLIARLESDHFAVFTKTDNITAERMNRFCNQRYMDGTKKMSYLIRCGVYNITDHTKKVTYMLDQAKLAEISISVDQVIPYLICNRQMSRNYLNQRRFVSELDSSLKKGEFVPYYQPIVDARTHEIVSAEALIRWNHSERGLVPPGQFIPVFEKEGLTSKLTGFMINSILDFNEMRRAKGQRIIPCSVNVSRVDFYDTTLMDFMKQKISNQENVSEMIKLEITESAYVTLESGAVSFLKEMQKLNLSVLLDDFGSGMSSMSTLELYDFDIIKLDMGFIKKIGKNQKTEAIIRHIISLAHTMNAKVVAEGVETKEQLEFLQSVDCDMIQGYYFYKPMPEEEFVKLI